MITSATLRKENEISLTNYILAHEIYGILAVPGAARLKLYEEGDAVMYRKSFYTSNHVVFPKEIIKICGWTVGQKLRVYKDGQSVFIYSDEYEGDGSEFDKLRVFVPSCKEDPSIQKKAKRAATQTVLLRRQGNSRGLNLKGFLHQIGVKGSEKVAFTCFAPDSRCWIEVRKIHPEEGDFPKMPKNNGSDVSRFNGITFARNLNGYLFIIPSCFYKQGKEAMLPVWVDTSREAIVIELPTEICAVCGEEIRSTISHKRAYTGKKAQSELGPKKAIHALVEANSILK